MNNFLLGFFMCVSIAALVFSYRAYKHSKAAFTIIKNKNKNVRTVVVNTDDNHITIIKECKNEPIKVNG